MPVFPERLRGMVFATHFVHGATCLKEVGAIMGYFAVSTIFPAARAGSSTRTLLLRHVTLNAGTVSSTLTTAPPCSARVRCELTRRLSPAGRVSLSGSANQK